ncbi:MAG: phage tail tube protein [Rhizomicrobium sp.]
MASTNRVQVASVKETTVGTTPASPRMRARRTTGEGLKWVPTFVDSEELRDDGMNGPPIKTGEDSNGDIKFELSYPYPATPQSTDIESAFHNTWSATNFRDNDGTADSVITAVATTNEVLTVITGTAFAANELYRFLGFGVAGNNSPSAFKCTQGSATVPRFVGSGITDEAVPPAGARVKCVGFQGDAGDINATANGISSTSLDFTTIAALQPGKWLKIGGTGAGNRFVTAALNDWVRIIAVAAHAVTFDNLPSGWATETGTGLTVKFWFGDQIKNGTTQIGQTIEKGFLGQAVPTYIKQPGMVVSQYTQDWTAKTKITGSVTFMGMGGASQSIAPLDAVPDPTTSLTQFPVMAASANVGRIAEAGSRLAAPNFVQSLKWTIDNQLTAVDAIDSMGPAAISSHSRKVTLTINTYFGDNTLLAKFFAGTLTSLNARVAKDSRAVILSFPQLTYNGDGSPNADAMNKDVMLSLQAVASKDETVTGAMILMDRIEWFEN